MNRYVIDTDICTGCLACYNTCKLKAIDIVIDSSGCKYPIINEDKCVKCQECIRVCNSRKRIMYERKYAYFCAGNHDEIRVESTSGGVFSEIAIPIINSGGVVFGVAWNEQNEAVYISACTIEDLKPLRKSKYVHSNVDYIYREVKKTLEERKVVLFSGTPCIIGGLKGYLGKEYEKLLCVEIICHGVPGAGIWNEYLRILEGTIDSKIEDVVHRYGEWREEKAECYYRYKNSDTGENIEIITGFEENAYMKGFSENNILMEACYSCEFRGKHSVSDITIGDAWGYIELMGRKGSKKGVSIAIINSLKGEQMFKYLVEKESVLIEKKIDIDELKKYNTPVFCNPIYGRKYLKFKKLYRDSSYKEAFEELIKPTREELYKELKEKWFQSCVEGKSIIDSYIKDKKIQKLVIYGSGSLGYDLIRYIVSNSIEVDVLYCIDANPEKFKEIDIMMYSSSEIEKIPKREKIDAVIITPIHAKDAIRKMLLKYYSCNIVSLDEIFRLEKI